MEVLQFVGYRMAQSGGTSVVLVTTDLVTLLNTGIVTIIILRTLVAFCTYSFFSLINTSSAYCITMYSVRT